jgi:hypothetical protein
MGFPSWNRSGGRDLKKCCEATCQISRRRGHAGTTTPPAPISVASRSFLRTIMQPPSLNTDAPIHRPIAAPGDGRVVENPQVGRLHHRYEPQAA